MLFQVPLKFIITRLRERPIEYMLKVFELSDCVFDGALLLVLLPSVHGLRHHMWLCTAQSRLVFMDTPGITKVDWQPPAKIFKSPLSHTYTHSHTFLNVAWGQRSCFSFPVDVKERTAFFFICGHTFWPFYPSCMGSKTGRCLMII